MHLGEKFEGMLKEEGDKEEENREDLIKVHSFVPNLAQYTYLGKFA